MTSLALRPGQLVRIRHQRWRVLNVTTYGRAQAIDVRGCEAGNAARSATFLSPAEEIELLCHTLPPRRVSPRAWRHGVRRKLAAAVPSPQSLRSAAAADMSILPFQLEPALAVLSGVGQRLLIADAVGLGKTIQAGLIIAEIAARSREPHVLVLTPAALREQWQSELVTRFGLPVTALDAATVAAATATLPPGVNPWAAHAVIVASIDYVKQPEVRRALESIVWDALVLDEAHALANRSERSAAAATLATRARVVIALSATPHSGDVASFERLCCLGRLSANDPMLLFRRDRGTAGNTARRKTRWLAIAQSPRESRMHESLLEYVRLVSSQLGHQGNAAAPARLAMTVLLKRACSCAASLVRSLRRRLRLLESAPADDVGQAQLSLVFEDAEPYAVLAAPGLPDRGGEIHTLQRLIDLAEDAAQDERKLAALERLVRRCAEPALVFTEYRDTLAAVASRLRGVDVAVVHGGLTAGERREAIRRFTTGTAQLLLATDAASEGLNLHHRCRLAVHIELPWTPLRLEQRTGRIDRLGQPRTVHAVHLVARQTHEELTVQRLLTRQSLSESAMQSVAGLDVAQIVADTLFDGDAAGPRDDGGANGLRREDAHARHRPPEKHDGRALIVVPDLRGAAADEAERLLMARRLTTLSPPEADGRPVVTRLRRRRRLAAFAITFESDGGGWVHEQLLGLEGPGEVRLTNWREAIGVLTALSRRMENRPPLEVQASASAIARTAAIMLAREHAILRHLEYERSALRPVQRGLFGRQASDGPDALSVTVDAAVWRCRLHLEHLERLRHVVPVACHLAFAAIG